MHFPNAPPSISKQDRIVFSCFPNYLFKQKKKKNQSQIHQSLLQGPISSSMAFSQGSKEKILVTQLGKLKGAVAWWLTLICAFVLKLIKKFEP